MTFNPDMIGVFLLKGLPEIFFLTIMTIEMEQKSYERPKLERLQPIKATSPADFVAQSVVQARFSDENNLPSRTVVLSTRTPSGRVVSVTNKFEPEGLNLRNAKESTNHTKLALLLNGAVKLKLDGKQKDAAKVIKDADKIRSKIQAPTRSKVASGLLVPSLALALAACAPRTPEFSPVPTSPVVSEAIPTDEQEQAMIDSFDHQGQDLKIKISTPDGVRTDLPISDIERVVTISGLDDPVYSEVSIAQMRVQGQGEAAIEFWAFIRKDGGAPDSQFIIWTPVGADSAGVRLNAVKLAIDDDNIAGVPRNPEIVGNAVVPVDSTQPISITINRPDNSGSEFEFNLGQALFKSIDTILAWDAQVAEAREDATPETIPTIPPTSTTSAPVETSTSPSPTVEATATSEATTTPEPTPVSQEGVYLAEGFNLEGRLGIIEENEQEYLEYFKAAFVRVNAERFAEVDPAFSDVQNMTDEQVKLALDNYLAEHNNLTPDGMLFMKRMGSILYVDLLATQKPVDINKMEIQFLNSVQYAELVNQWDSVNKRPVFDAGSLFALYDNPFEVDYVGLTFFDAGDYLIPKIIVANVGERSNSAFPGNSHGLDVNKMNRYLSFLLELYRSFQTKPPTELVTSQPFNHLENIGIWGDIRDIDEESGLAGHIQMTNTLFSAFMSGNFQNTPPVLKQRQP